MQRVVLYGTDRELNAASVLLGRSTIDVDWYYQCSGKEIWYHVYTVEDIVNDVNVVAALSDLYPLLLYRFYDGTKPMQGPIKGVDSDDLTNYNTSRNWNIHDILTRNYTLGYNLYPMDMRTNLTAVYQKLAATKYKAMADEALSVEEAIPRLSALAPSEEEYPIINARQWLVQRRHDLLQQDKTDERQQRITVVSAVITMIDEHIRSSTI